MREGGLEAPKRLPILWQDEAFYDEKALDDELRRVFDVCHTCRRCFNLCDSFPKLFDLIDESSTGELDAVESKDFAPVVDACTLCDMCYMSVCPYTPPHEFNIDFPHLMLRYRAVQDKKGEGASFIEKTLAQTDALGKIGSALAPMTNFATGNALSRFVMEKTLGIDRKAALPEYASKTLMTVAEKDERSSDRKVVFYATCYGNFNTPDIGLKAAKVLSDCGIANQTLYPECCGMPQFEQGKLEDVAQKAKKIAAYFESFIDEGHAIVALVPSCALMLKSEWPLLLPEDKAVQKLAASTYDLSEYFVELAGEGFFEGKLNALSSSVTVHMACHARAQNMGKKAVDLLNYVPDLQINVIERCSGHGGTWGIYKENFETALKVGKPLFKKTYEYNTQYVVSECPLAGLHLSQGLEMNHGVQQKVNHPIELFFEAYKG